MCNKTLSRRDLLIKMLAVGGATLLPGLAFGKSISHLSGRVWVNGRLANKNTIIEAGDSIVTGNRSSIVFVVDKDAYKLGSRSRLILRSSFGFISTLRLLSGTLLAVFAPGKKTISTPTATAGIRGTGVFVNVDNDKNRTYFCTCYGEVELNTVNSKEKGSGVETYIAKADHHNARYVGGDINNPTIEKAKLIDHTDDELIMLESLFGRKPPFA